jgi:hypothetical protein
VISSIRRRGVLVVLVVLPDGSHSLMPANWTDWNAEQARRTPANDAGGALDLGRLGDLLHLRKIINALYDRPVESVQCKESNHATEPGLSRPPRSSTEPFSSSPVGDDVGQLDEASRIAALEILSRLIARMISARSMREASDE